ncbi:MAG: DUF523 domain-containing protein [Clostridiales bacterium]|nr:DUF523 domain-containing protein [Clostridiales bacterium]
MKKILISECLYGERAVRYDGGKIPLTDPILLRWKAEGRLVPVCPELLGGLNVPRAEAQRRGDRVMTRDGDDVTAAFEAGAAEALRIAVSEQAAFALLKDSSPSCGVKRIHDGSFSGQKIAGRGLTADLLTSSGFRVFSEDGTEDALSFLVMLETAKIE